MTWVFVKKGYKDTERKIGEDTEAHRGDGL